MGARILTIGFLGFCLAQSAFALPAVFVAGDLDSALALAEDQDKLVFLYIYQEHRTQLPGASSYGEAQYEVKRNHLCVQVEEQVLPNPTVLEALDSMVCISVGVDEDKSIFGKLGLDAVYPTFAWMDGDGTVLATLGACFEPLAYALVTSQAEEIRSLRARDELNDSQRRRLGTLYYDVGRYELAANTLAPLVRKGTDDREAWILYAFALRATDDADTSIQVLNQVLEGCQSRNATRDEAASIKWGPSVEYEPVVLEADGEFVAILYNLGNSPKLLPTIEALESALAEEPSTSAAAFEAAGAFYDGENWARAAELYQRASDGPIRGREREEALARQGLAHVFTGDTDAATASFEAYLDEDMNGMNRPAVVFFLGGLYLGTSLEVFEDGDFKVTDKDGHARAADLLSELVTEHPTSAYAKDAKDLLLRFFDRSIER